MRFLILLAFVITPLTGWAQDRSATIQDVVESHILPGFTRLASASTALSQAAQADCAASSEGLRGAFNEAFDAWIGVSHLRFGPTETGNRAFALAFWPDPRSAAPKALSAMIESEDPVVESADAFQTVSIAARGFYALEFLLYDPQISALGSGAYRCALIRAVAADIDNTAQAILTDWQDHYAALLISPENSDVYRSEEEVLQELFKALTTGLQFTADTRLGRPLGTFDQPRPARAEARRAGRSLRHVQLSLIALRDLAQRLASISPEASATLDAAFGQSLDLTERLDDPVFAGVADPQGRLRVEALQQSIGRIREIAATDLGPALGVAAGFNALDGD
tara:strand:+ start:917 stop:1930 length:1014 start_codon:yes stop_codon:yes gene_type:complete